MKIWPEGGVDIRNGAVWRNSGLPLTLVDIATKGVNSKIVCECGCSAQEIWEEGGFHSSPSQERKR